MNVCSDRVSTLSVTSGHHPGQVVRLQKHHNQISLLQEITASSLSCHPAFHTQPLLGQWSFPRLNHLCAGYIALLCSSHKVHSYQDLSFPKLTHFSIPCFFLVIVLCFPNHLYVLFLFALPISITSVLLPLLPLYSRVFWSGFGTFVPRGTI